MNLPKVAVLLAACNGRQWLDQQLDSILSQKHVDLKIIVSVDISSDDTLLHIERCAQRDPRIKLLPYGQKFGGAAANFFRLILDAPLEEFDYIALADQDDVWFDAKLCRAVEEMKTQDADGYSGNVLAFWPEKNQEKMIIKATRRQQWDFLFEGPGPGCTFVLTRPMAVALRRHILSRREEMRSLDWHDWFIYAFARANGYRWHIDAKPMMHYRQHERNQLGANAGVRALFYRIGKIADGYAINQAAATARILGLDQTSFVRQWITGRRIGFMRLACYSFQCRRRNLDRLFFCMTCMLYALRPPKMKGPSHD